MNIGSLQDLARRWRDEAAHLRHRGMDREAHLIESFANDYEETLQEWHVEALTLEVAADESGFKYSTLQQRLASGDLPNAGEKGAPRIRRCDLPDRGGAKLREVGGEPDLAAQILIGS